jgi:hypothetical protein
LWLGRDEHVQANSGVIEPCGKLALYSIAATPGQSKEFFLESDETEGWNAPHITGVHVVAITIKQRQPRSKSNIANSEV